MHVTIHPTVTAVSVEGVQFAAQEDGTFLLPDNDAIVRALTEHGLSVHRVGDADPAQLPVFVSTADAEADLKAQIAALQAQIATLQAEKPVAAVLPPGTKRDKAAKAPDPAPSTDPAPVTTDTPAS
jgi:hypothetical protein